MKKNILKNIPRPILEKAQNLIQDALTSKEVKDGTARIPRKDVSFIETLYIDRLTLSDIIKWGKDNLPSGPGISMAVTKEENNKKNYPIKVSVAFVDENQEVICNDAKGAIMYCSSVDENLQETFGDEDIIILQ